MSGKPRSDHSEQLWKKHFPLKNWKYFFSILLGWGRTPLKITNLFISGWILHTIVCWQCWFRYNCHMESFYPQNQAGHSGREYGHIGTAQACEDALKGWTSASHWLLLVLLCHLTCAIKNRLKAWHAKCLCKTAGLATPRTSTRHRENFVFFFLAEDPEGNTYQAWVWNRDIEYCLFYGGRGNPRELNAALVGGFHPCP